ncbi:MAG: CBM96 family carbohydrate-binding protein [Nocardioidaceae bacterium]
MRRTRLFSFAAWSALTAVAVLAALLGVPRGPQPAHAADLATPIRAAFYYPWFPETWHTTDHYHPSLGQYSSDDATVLAKHMDALRYAGEQAVISSWWGVGSKTDLRLPNVLSAAAAKGLSVTAYYEPEGTTDPTVAQIQANLVRLHMLAQDPAWLRVGGKPVLFVYNANDTTCAVVDRWKQATAGTDWYLNLKVFSGYATCANQPDSWHQYGPAAATDRQGTNSYTVSPGFFVYNETTPRLARDLTRFTSNLASQLASGAKWQLMTTFNEWGEGTPVESATEWASASGYGTYLDAMHDAYLGNAPPPARVTLGNVADATVNNTSATTAATNYGSTTTLQVDASPSIRSYLKFSITGLTRPVTKATLRLWAGSSNAGYKAYSVASTTWTETGITYNDAPPLGTLLGASGTTATSTWSQVDVTLAVTGNGTVSIGLAAASTIRLSLNSKEGRHPPQLVIEQG